MIRFTCKQCGKSYERPDSSSGTLVFCDCGAGNWVPWATDPTAPVPREAPPAYPDEPLPVVPVEVPMGRSIASAANCCNHPGTPMTQTCADCGASFCDDCVLTLEGQVRCGPCKNYFLRNRHRPPQLSVAAVFSLILAVVAGPMALMAQLVGMDMGSAQGVLIITAFCVGVQLTAIVLGAFALSNQERDRRIGGRGVALSGVVTGLVTLVLTVETAIHMLRTLG